MQNQISLKYRHSVVLPLAANSTDMNSLTASVSASMMQLGFVPSKDLVSSLNQLTENQISKIFNELITHLQKMKGADVKYNPMYPNFPQQVMETSDLELFINAIFHYWTYGEWSPDYKVLERQVDLEKTTFKEIGVISEEEFDKIFGEIITSNESISAADKKAVKWFIENGQTVAVDMEIPFKENLCLVASLMLEKGNDITGFIKTATDLLRVATYLSDGDISLAENTKFKSFSRTQRRMFVGILDEVASLEDLNRHRGKWVKLFHSLHVGEYSNSLFELAKKLRSNETIETFNSRVEAAFRNNDIAEAIDILTARPGEFARRLDHLLRQSDQPAQVVDKFLNVADKVNTRLLLQVAGHMKTRSVDVDKRVVFPKGNTQRATIVRSKLLALDDSIVREIDSGIRNILTERFATGKNLGKVWIDPALMDCPLPTQQRSASESLMQVARGTSLPFGDNTKNTLRFFIYWIGDDIDLSATLHDEKFKMIEQISYTNLRSINYDACHSGDIVQAPRGASEFIDITIDKAVKFGVRYVVMNVLVYSGPSFAEHKKVYAGWMTRDKPKSNEIYDPKTVEQKVDLTSASKNNIPVVFDLVERKAIFADLNTSTSYMYGGNNIHSNRASIQETLEAVVSLDNKITLYELFMLHAIARGELVGNKDDADSVFSISEGITPYDISIINSEYLD